MAEKFDEKVEVHSGDIEFQNVAFKYDENKENVLSSLNLKIA